ncbi:MAG: hypothetical protein ACYTHM_10115 [Planctomycetota bacterium]|jgi:hypothetical protein
MSKRTRWPILFAILLFPGCAQYLVRPHTTYPTARVFTQAHARVWGATLEALHGVPLATLDRESGIIISDWVRGTSDIRYYGLPDRPYRMLQIRYKMTVRLKGVEGGTLVSVDLYEETNTPRTVSISSPSTRPFLFRDPTHRCGWHPSLEDWETVQRVDVDDWNPTPSSTWKEKALLDRIGGFLRDR